MTDLSAQQIVAYGEEMKVITRRTHPLGDLVQMSDEAAVLAAYYRNNIVHLFALPSLIACAFAGNASMSHADILRLTGRIYPYIAAELFLIWPEEEVARRARCDAGDARGPGAAGAQRRGRLVPLGADLPAGHAVVAAAAVHDPDH